MNRRSLVETCDDARHGSEDGILRKRLAAEPATGTATSPGRAKRGLSFVTSAAAALQRTSRIRVDLSLKILDAVLTAGAYLIVLVLRFDGVVPDLYWSRFLHFVPVAVLLHVAWAQSWGLYGHMWRHASIDEARRMLLSGFSAIFVLAAGSTALDGAMPLSVVVLGGFVATTLSGLLRFQSRLFALRRRSDGAHNNGPAGIRVVVVGAGEGGAAMIRETKRTVAAGQRPVPAGLRPVAIVDDDPRKRGLHLLGVPIVGDINDLPDVIQRYDAHQVLLAIPSADQALVRRIAKLSERASTVLKILPPVHEILNGDPTVRDVRNLSVEDLLGRKQVVTDPAGVLSLLAERTVLITGAGGSVGSEIARQVARCEPGRLLLLDHDETHLFEIAGQLSFPAEQILMDIRDEVRVRQLFHDVLPDVVFHAAAHKHVPVLEKHPCEAVRTNVFGTQNVARSAAAVGVRHLVFISTDKAVRPTSVMGASKWLGEQIVVNLAPPGHGWCAVRFGNVFGSRGSVIPVFERQIRAGGPVTVTDPRMERFFMSVHEAVQLVLQSAVFAEGGEIFELDMGDPVNILGLAEKMIRLSGRSAGTEIPIEFVGMRPGEKLIEELRHPDEAAHPTLHPSIVRLEPLRIDPLSIEAFSVDVARMADADLGDEVRRSLLAMASGHPSLLSGES